MVIKNRRRCFLAIFKSHHIKNRKSQADQKVEISTPSTAPGLDKVEHEAHDPTSKAGQDDHGHADDHDHDGGELAGWRSHLDLLGGLAILLVMLVLEYGTDIDLKRPWAIIVYVIAYFLAGRSTLAIAARRLRCGDVFNEFSLMSIATIGAFAIGEYAEGVAVMILS